MNRGCIDPITTESLKIKFEDSVKAKLQAKYPKTRYELILPFASMLIQISWNETLNQLTSTNVREISTAEKIRFFNEMTELSASCLFEDIVEEQEETERIFA